VWGRLARRKAPQKSAPAADPRAALRVRVKRFAALRAAERTGAAACPSPGLERLERRLRELRPRLQKASQALDAGKPDNLGFLRKVDALLDDLEGKLRAELVEMPAARLRPLLPKLGASGPGPARALLDVLIFDPERAPAAANLIDCLVTFLATERSEGVRRVVHEPTHLTVRLSELCAAMAERADDPRVEKAAEHLAAAREKIVLTSAIWPIVERVQMFKIEASELLLYPQVLREVVLYNVAVANRVAKLTGERPLGESEWLGIDMILEEASAAADEAASAFDAGTVCRVEEAVRERLRGGAGPSGPLAEIVAGLLPGELGRIGEGAFRRGDGSETSIPRIVRVGVALGLLMRRAREGADSATLGCERHVLEQRWIPEVDARFGSAVRKCMEKGMFKEARQLAEIRTRFLHPPADVDPSGLEPDTGLL
jgi:hypothetical protein